MKTSIVVPLGTSPPVATELLQYLKEGEGAYITDLTLITTSDQMIKVSAFAVKTAVAVKYPEVRVHEKTFPRTDIDSYDANLEFLRFAAGVLRDEIEKHMVSTIFVNLAGGRKDMVVDLMLISQFYPVKAAFHIIMPDVKSFNIELERIRNHLDELYQSEDPMRYYKERKELLDRVMFPDPSTYRVIPIPIFPFPKFVLSRLRLLRRDKPLQVKQLKLPEEYIQRLKSHKIISEGRHGVYLTELGQTMLEIFV